MEDDFIGHLARSNFDAFVADLRADPQQKDLEKSLREHRQSEDVDHQINSFFEDLELRAAGGRSNPAPRLRSEREEFEPEWKPGDDDVNLGLDEPLAKRGHRKAARVVKNENGTVCEYDAAGSLIRCYAAGVDPSSFDDLDKTCHCDS